MKLRLILLCALVLSEAVLFAQNETKSSYWVQLKDKKGTPYQISNPGAFLSERAISRRIRQQIALDETDLPVSPVYLDSLRNRGLEVVHTSKWLNGTTVRTADTALMRKIEKLPFVVEIQLTKPADDVKSAALKFREEEVTADYDPVNYGTALNQLTQLNGEYLHKQGFRGKGIQVAILDAGFWHVNEITAFDSLRNTNRILGKRDFVDPESDIYQQHYHGMSVLSCMAGNLSGNFLGTAPEASYYLLRSEDAPTEYLIEEDNWVAAAEFADSLGVDLINSSLGYSEFNDPQMDHPYSDLNGKTTRITRGANLAFQKGILVFNSAGNEGDDPWRYIIAPSDGENVIAVGAVTETGIRIDFSSVGPAFGGAVKPNVAAQGYQTHMITSAGILGFANGTSFSSPVLAGMGACLLQANPDANVQQVKMAIEQSGSQFNAPDSLLGYGIPDFEKADKYLKLNLSINLKQKDILSVLPNPFNDYLFIHNLHPEKGENCLIRIFNLQGVCLWESTLKTSKTITLNNLGSLPDGVLVLSVRCGETEERRKLIKVALQ